MKLLLAGAPVWVIHPQKSPERLDRMSTEINTERGRDCALIYDTISTRVASCIHTSRRDGGEPDEERGRALGREVGSDVTELNV